MRPRPVSFRMHIAAINFGEKSPVPTYLINRSSQRFLRHNSLPFARDLLISRIQCDPQRSRPWPAKLSSRRPPHRSGDSHQTNALSTPRVNVILGTVMTYTETHITVTDSVGSYVVSNSQLAIHKEAPFAVGQPLLLFQAELPGWIARFSGDAPAIYEPISD
ncbi:unnamed protein product [Bursaphelenchus xylophilus]|uniref:(pine wood nematode) hypothetical protein n=1 Tax=Bursaphelenchus xylophilus TaxID=6326 RepID=A0A1I7SVJ9_BURXY|nr:unnamed protein product [Bursaphelenchus xylophilus]CAG9101570.1 unnamed protein product [Bursaphelenchus xylophilus]